MEENGKEQNEATVNSKLKNAAKDSARIVTKAIANKIKAGLVSIISSILPILLPVLAAVIVVVVLLGAFEYLIELASAEELPKEIYKAMDVGDVTELVEIKEDSNGNGYHLEFVADFDEKLEKAIETFNSSVTRNVTIKDKDTLKKFIMAEVATKFPNLAGTGGNSIYIETNGSGYWWPIGSSSTTTKNGVTYASGTPEIALGSSVVRGGMSKGWSSERTSQRK